MAVEVVLDIEPIREHAARILRDSGALGRFPTPIDDILSTARLVVDTSMDLHPDHLDPLYKSRGRDPDRIRRAAAKVAALVDVVDRRIYLNRDGSRYARPFLLLHETGHAVLPWQRKWYLFEEDDASLDPYVQDLFEREASAFAAEVVFQMEVFDGEAARLPLVIQSAIDLSKQFGASIYATLRRFVDRCPSPVALLVLDLPPEPNGEATLRRSLASPAFIQEYGSPPWPKTYGLDALGLPHLDPSRTRRTESGEGHLGFPVASPAGSLFDPTVETFFNGYVVFALLSPTVRPFVAMDDSDAAEAILAVQASAA